jgi:hypothetical protein
LEGCNPVFRPWKNGRFAYVTDVTETRRFQWVRQ